MASSFTRNEISILLECAICLDVVKNPRRLACEHFFCKSCLDKLLEFADDGSCIIRCPKQCTRYTSISNKCTTNDLGVDYMMNGMIEMVANNDKSSNRMENKPTCGASTQCNKDISHYCPFCNTFVCKSCRCLHDKNQYFPVIYNTEYEQIKVTCEKHSTDANYLCCDPCCNEFICLYCSHRDHIGHSYDTLQNQAGKMKDNLHKGIQNISEFNKKLEVTLQQTENDIAVAKDVLDETLTYRKLLCLNDYLHYLNKEEERLNAAFYSVTINHRKQYAFKQDYTDFYEKIASKVGISVVMQTKSVLNNISLYNNDNINITEETLTLSDHCFNANNPLGNINVEAGKRITIDGDRKCFKSKLANMGDNSMGNNAVNVYENLQCLLQENFPKSKETSGQLDPVLFDNVMQENERLKDNLMKLKEHNAEIVAVNNDWDKAYNALRQQFEESNKQLTDEIAKKEEENNRTKAKLERFVSEEDSNGNIFVNENEEDNMDPTREQGQGPLTASILAKLSQRGQKQKIGEQLFPLVKEIEPCEFVYLMDILLKIDNLKLLNMLESPQLLSAEVGRALQYFKAHNNKEMVARYVERAMTSDEKLPLYSSDSMDPNEQEPLTASLLATVSLREQKQMIGERLFPLVQKISPSEFVYIMHSLLKIDNIKLLSMLESHELLSAEVERAVKYSKAQNDKERIARYVAKAMDNNRN